MSLSLRVTRSAANINMNPQGYRCIIGIIGPTPHMDYPWSTRLSRIQVPYRDFSGRWAGMPTRTGNSTIVDMQVHGGQMLGAHPLPNGKAVTIAIPCNVDGPITINSFNHPHVSPTMPPIAAGPIGAPIGYRPHRGVMVFSIGCPVDPFPSVTPRTLIRHTSFSQSIGDISGTVMPIRRTWITHIRPGSGSWTIARKREAVIRIFSSTKRYHTSICSRCSTHRKYRGSCYCAESTKKSFYIHNGIPFDKRKIFADLEAVIT